MSRTSDRILGMVDLAKVTRSVCLEGAVAKVQTAGLGPDDEAQMWQPYGFGSAPLAGAEAIRVAVGSHREQMVAMVVDDRRYRISLAAGEVAISDDLGQKVHLTRTGIVVKGAVVHLGDGSLLAVDGVVTGRAIDTFTGATQFALGNASTTVRAKS